MKNLIMVGAFFASTIIVVIGMMFTFNLGMSILALDTIPTMFKVITIVLAVVFVLFISYALFVIGKKFLWARIAEIAIALVVVFLILMFSNAVFETFSDYIIDMIEKIIG